jgi:3-oxoacyl-[acyl-carrier protein] reductase
MNILITGGASGLGEFITRYLCGNENHKVYFTYNSSHEQALQIQAEYKNATPLRCNFSEEKDIVTLQNNLSSYNLDVLVHNAYHGNFISNHFHKLPATDFAESFHNNIIPIVQITQEAIKIFRKKRFGRIINILSAVLVNKPPIGASVYTAVKAYHESLSKSWATENGVFGITSNCISPGMMKTSLTSKIDERIMEQIIANHPLKELVTPEEVARAVTYFVSASAHVNGTHLVLNAGMDIQ